MIKYKEAIASTEEYKNIASYIERGLKAVTVTGLPEGAKTHFVASLSEDTGKNILYVAPTELEAKNAAENFKFFLGESAEVAFFPQKDYVFHNVEAMNNDVIYDRINCLHLLKSADKPVIITVGAAASVQYTVPKELYDEFELSAGETVNLSELTKKLIFMGYLRSENVEGVGQFSIRGGIVDIFSPGELYPVRIEFWGDEIDTLRSFDPQTQLSVKSVQKAYIVPCRELVYSSEAVSKIVKKINAGENEQLLADVERFENKHYFSSADKYLPYIYGEIPIIGDYFDDGICVFDNLPSVKTKIKVLREQIAEETANLAEKGMIKLRKGAEYVQKFSYITECGGFKLGLEMLTKHNDLLKSNAAVNFAARAVQPYFGNTEQIVEDIKFWHESGYGINIVSGSRTKAEAFAKTLKENDFLPVIKNDEAAEKGEIVIMLGNLKNGFEYPLAKFVVLCDKDIFGNERTQKKVRRMAGTKIKSYNDLESGDLVVHHIHGIGRYLGMHRMEVDGIKKDYLKIMYREGDILYIPATALHLINKYIASEGGSVRLNKMGGAEFSRLKGKVQKSVEEMAAKLVKLYAARLNAKGYAFAPDSDWQKNFEDDFPYEETDDQLKCIEEVKRDMESEKPMDRLLCGDVGFGKTEIALRAAFKAVVDGKQVAYLVPTTVLARQHFGTFSERMAKYPIKVEMLSRFKSSAEQKKVIHGLKDGSADVVIGTHRLLQKDVEYKDLGLLIIDEEQRFGVADKEKIKELKNSVDVLTLSATPIPRTMHMAMIGIRDMSVINEPPQDRQPVRTYVMEYEREVIAEAIEKELDRGGQVYYVYNKIDGIERVAAEIQAMVPEARIAVGHGRMNERELEEIMLSMMDGSADILICTTIIETGLDIPNVNTIIVENADCMGLSQLYQLRGRVGRSNRTAYAYFTYRKNKEINETAEKRLKSIREFTEFGSGFKIAMRDLAIRGAGNVLGPQQHGAMDAVGYDMYCKLLSRAVANAKGEEVKEEIVTSIDLKVDAFIPESYIESENIRIEMYKRISGLENEDEVSEITDELIDRFSEPPQCVTNLISIALIGKYAARAGVSEIAQRGDFVNFYVECSTEKQRHIIRQLHSKHKDKLMFIEDKKPHIMLRIRDEDKLFDNIKFVLQEFYILQNNEI